MKKYIKDYGKNLLEKFETQNDIHRHIVNAMPEFAKFINEKHPELKDEISNLSFINDSTIHTININKELIYKEQNEEIKKKEKETQTWSSSPLRDIPKELPSLTRAVKTLKKIDKLYDNVSPISKTKEEILKSAEKISICEGKESELIFEAGNLLVALSKLAMQMHLPTEQILNDRIDDMIDRYES